MACGRFGGIPSRDSAFVNIQLNRQENSKPRHFHSVKCILKWSAKWRQYICFKLHSWWHHQMEIFFASLALCVGNSLVTVEFPSQRPVTRTFDVFFDLPLDKQLNKNSISWWFEAPSLSLWRHFNYLHSRVQTPKFHFHHHCELLYVVPSCHKYHVGDTFHNSSSNVPVCDIHYDTTGISFRFLE